jgi:hypothetical protein
MKKFKIFLESIETENNKEIVDTIKKGFRICFEGYEELISAMNMQELKDIASKYGKPGSTLEIFGEFGSLADINQRNLVIKEIREELEDKIPTVNDEDIEELNKLLSHIEEIPLDDIDAPMDVDKLGRDITPEEEELGKRIASEYLKKINETKLEASGCKPQQPESITISCISLINKCLKYLEVKGDNYLPNRLIDYMTKLDVLYGDFDNEAQREFDEINKNFKNMNIEQIKEKLIGLRGILMSYLPEEIRHLEAYL